MPLPSEQELKHLEQQLRIQREALQAHLRVAWHTAEGERYLAVAGSVHSQSDESFAELSTALTNASLGREMEVLREIGEALHRLHVHSYGYCVDCGQSIALPRLRTYPAAKRCVQCQLHKEDPHGGKDPTPSL